MNKTLFDDLSARINEALRNSPAQDIEKNLRALLAGWFDRMDVVLREDFEFQARRITVNLAPAELPKDSSRFDLPIALGILAASGQLSPEALTGHEFAGELSLTGELRAVRGALAMALSARSAGRAFVLPA